MAPMTATRLLQEMILLEHWPQVSVQLDLLPSHGIATCLTGLSGAQLDAVFGQLPSSRRPAVFAHLRQREQDLLLDTMEAASARKLLRGLLPEHQQALLRSSPKADKLHALLPAARPNT